MTINNIQDYINAIEKLKNKYTYEMGGINNYVVEPQFLFRGHGNHKKYKLEPNILRTKKTQYGSTTQFSQLEYNILSDFISEARAYEKNIMDNDIKAWLEMAQHYKVPTRLLDFTENPLVALYFACRSKSEEVASVWIIDEKRYENNFWDTPYIKLALDSQTIVSNIIEREILLLGKPEKNNVQDYPYPWIYKPKYQDERMKLQSSMFMIWGSKECALTEMISEHNYMNMDDNEVITSDSPAFLYALEIDSEGKSEILKQLDMLGINEKFIYPGLEGIGKTIAKKYSAV